MERTSVFSNNQLNKLIVALNEAKFPSLAGKYGDEYEAKKRKVESLSMTISDENNRDRTFDILIRGDSAPRAYFKLTIDLSLLLAEKFPGRGTARETKKPFSISSETLVSLRLETSGGFAGIHSVLEIKPRPMSSSIGGWMWNWSQTIGGRTEKAEGDITLEIPKLIELLNAANFPKLNGKDFKEKNLADGFGEVVTLKLKGGQTFTVSNYGNTAPKEYFALTQYLNETKAWTLPTQ